MKTSATRRPLFVTMAILALIAILLSTAGPALADSSPWEDTDFIPNSGTTNVVISGGSVRLTQSSGSLDMADAYGWQYNDTVWSSGHVELSSSLQWLDTIHRTNHVYKTGDGQQLLRDERDIDITGATRMRVRANLWRSDDDYNTYLEVYVGPNGVINATRSSTSPRTYEAITSNVYDNVRLYLEGSTDCWWIFCWDSTANNDLLDVDLEKTVYATPGTVMHTYDAGHQVAWNTFTPDVTTPSGSSVSYTFWTSDNGSTWTSRSNWTAVQNNPSRYLRVEATLSTSNNLQTPTLNDIDITYNYYQSSGTLTSATRNPLANNGTQVDDWGAISWIRNLPAGTNVQFQIATNTDSSTWNYVGPNCTAGTYYTTHTGQAINDACHANDQYIRYRAYFTVDAAHQASTPRLDDVTITYNQEPRAPDLVGPAGNIADDTPTFQWQAPSDSDGDTAFRYHLQVDNNSGFTSPEVNATNINTLNYTSGALADGTYWWRVRARDTVQGAGFSDPYGDWSSVYQIRIDSQEPGSSVTTSGAYGQAARPWPGQLDGTASDNAGGVGLDLVEVLVHDTTDDAYWNGSTWVSSPPSNWPDAAGLETWDLSLAVSNLTDGHDYEVDAKATDDVGNEQSVYGHATFSFDRSIGVGDFVWHDVNGNGAWDSGTDDVLSGVALTLTNESGATMSAITDGGGQYLFDGATQSPAWMAGTYTVTVDESTLPAGYTLTSDPDYPLALTLVNGETYQEADFGFGNFAIIEGAVFDDNGAGSGAARDGVRNGDEPGLADITVSLDGSSIPDEVTDADGRYRFKGVPAGSYSVNPDETDPDMPDYYVATSPDPLSVSDVAVGNVYADRNVGYAIPPAVDKPLYLRYVSGRRLSREPGTDTRIFGVHTAHYTWPLVPSVIGDVGLDTSQDATVHVYVDTAGANSEMEAELLDDTTSLGTGSVSVSGAGWYDIPIALTGNTIHDGNPVVLSIYHPDGESDFDVRVDGENTYRAYVELPVLRYIQVASLGTYDAAYLSGGGSATSDFETHDTVYVRVTASDPFGAYDVTGASVDIPGVSGTPFNMTQVAENATLGTRTFEYAYVDAAEGAYDPVLVTVEEGTEGAVDASASTSFRCRSADVWVTKSADPTTVQSEDTVQFTLDYGNEGVLNAQNVTVTDTLPAGLTFTGMIQGGAPNENGQELVWNLGTLNSSASGQLIFEATVDVTGEESDTFVNPAAIGTSTGEADTGDNDDDIDVTLSQNADLRISKTPDGTTIVPGQTIRYEIEIENRDYADAANGTVTDAVPEHTTFVDAELIPPTAGTVGTPDDIVTDLTVPGYDGTDYGLVTLIYTVTADSVITDGVCIVNEASVTSDQDSAGPATATNCIVSDHELSISKTPSANPAPAGETLTYTIEYGVLPEGDEPAPNVIIEDVYPTNASYVSCDGGTSCDETFPDSGVVEWSLGTLIPDASGVVTLVVDVDDGQPDGASLNNHVEISDDDGESAEYNYSGLVGAGHTLIVEKTDTGYDPVDAGQNLVYTIDYEVSGNEDEASDVFITDTVPVNTEYVSCDGGISCDETTPGSGIVRWELGDLDMGETGSVELTILVDDLLPEGTEIENTAHISDTNGGIPASEDETTTVNVWHSYTIEKSDDPADVVEAGALLTYTIDWQIDTSSTEQISGIFIEDTTPAHTTFESCTGGCTNPGQGYTGLVRWDIPGTHNPGDSGTVQLVVRVDSPLENELVLHNTVTIDDDDGDSSATSPDQTTTVHSDHDLTIEKTDAPDPVEAGAVLVYEITGGVTPDSNAIAPSVLITDRIPAHTTFTGDASTGYSYSASENVISWNLGDMMPDASEVVTFSVVVTSPLMNETTIENVAYISDDDDKAAQSGMIETTVHADHELRVEKTSVGNIDEDEADAVSGWIDYTIDYWVPGSGNEFAPGVVITDAVPAGTAFDSCSDDCTYPDANGDVRWVIGEMEPGEGGQVSFRVTLPDPLPDGTLIENIAHIFDADGESWQDDDGVVEVRSDHNLTIAKTDGPDPVDAGALLTYDISYSVLSSGNEPAPDVVIEDVIPLHTTFESCSDGCANPGVGGTGLVSWDLGMLMPGEGGSVQLTVRVDSPLDNGEDIFNSATVSDGDGETDSIQDIRTLVRSSHALSVQKSDLGYDPVNAGDELVYTIVYTVTGNESSYGATLVDQIPDHTSYVGCSGGVLCSRSGNQVTWILNRLNPDPETQVVTGTAHLILDVDSPLPHETLIHNTIRFYDNNTPQVTDDEETTVHSDYAYTIEKSAADEVESGDELLYTIDWTIDGNRPVYGVTITDTVPADTEYVDGSCSGGDACYESSGVVTWELGDPLYPPDAGQVSFRVAVDNLLPDGTEVVNRATIQDAAVSLESEPVTTTVHSDHALNLSKTDSPDPVEAGAVLEYTLPYTVTGNQVAPNVVLRDTIPDNTTFLDCAGCVGPDANGVISWTFGALTPPHSDSVSFRVTVTDVLPSGASIFNFADLSDDDGKIAHAYAETTVSSHHDLTLQKSDNGYDPVQAGELLTYTLSYGVQPDGNEPAPNVTIEDTTPAHTTFYTATGGIVQPSTPNQGSTGDVTWYLGDLLPGDGGVVTMVVQVDTPLDNGTLLYNTGDISDDDGGYAEDTEETEVESSHHFDIQKTGDDEVDAGDYIDYTIQFTVLGNEGADGVVITDAIPANTAYVNCGGDVSCIDYGTHVRWNFGDYDPGEGGIATLRVQVDNPLPDGTTIHNVADIYDDNDGTPNSDDHDTLVGSGHVLSIDKSDDPDPVSAGGLINYTLDWSVAGNETALGVVITDRVPLSTTFQSASGGVTPDANGVLTWDLGDRDPGANGSVDFTVQVNTPLPDGVYIYNTAHIQDTNGGYAQDAENTRVNANHTLSISKVDDPDPVSAGGLLTYTLNWSVSGNEPAPNVRIQDYVPSHTDFEACYGGDSCGETGGPVTWDLGDLEPGDSGSVTLVVQVDDLLNDGVLILNQATILDDDGVSDSSAQINTTVQSTHELDVTKTDTGYDPVQAGATLRYAIDYAVTGHETAQGVTIRDQVPVSTTFDHCTGGNLCGDAGGGLITWQLGDLAPGASGTVYLYLNVDSPLPDGTIIENTASIQDNNGGVTDSDDEETTVESDHDLTIGKSDAPDPVQAGAQVEYTIDYAVTGNQVAHGVVITDRIPTEAGFVSCSDGCSGPDANNVVAWNLGDLSPGSGSVTLLVDVDSPLPDDTILTNVVAIHDADGDSHYHQATETTTVESSHALHVTKSDDVDPVAPGGDIRYTIEWSVTGNEAAQAIVVSDTVPANTTFINVEDGGSYNASEDLVTWDVTSADPGGGGTVHFTVNVDDPLPDGTIIENIAEISDGNGGATDEAVEQTNVASGHALHVSKSDAGYDPVQAGSQIQYTIAYSVTGDEEAQGVTVVDALPAHTSFASCSDSCDVAGNTVTWDLDDLPPGTADSLTLVVDVASPLPDGTTLENEVNISDDNGGATDEVVEQTIVESAHSFILTKSGTPDPVAPDGVINYVINWEVTGNEAAETIVITDAIPASTSFESCGACVPHLADGYVQWTLPGSHDPNDSGSVSLQVRVDTPLEDETNIHNWARISDSNDGTPQTATSDIEVDSDHTLDVEKSGPSGAAAGDQIEYTISYQVYGDEPAPNVVITDTVPEHTSFVSADGGGTESGGVVTWNLNNLNPGDSGTLHMTVEIDDPLADGTEIHNTARISDDDTGTGATEDTVLTTVTSGHAFSIDKSDGPDPVEAGAGLTYTITWEVFGSEMAQNVVIVDQLPANVSFVSASDGGVYNGGTHQVTWGLGDQSPGESGTFVVEVDVASPLPNGTELENNVSISDDNDGIPADDAETSTVHSSHALHVDKDGPDTVDAGDQITYNVNWGVTGNENAESVSLVDTLPAHTSLSSCTGGCTPSGNTVTWDLGNQPHDASGSFTLVVDVASPLPDGTTLENEVNISDANGGATDGDSVQTTIESAHSFILTKSGTPDPVAPDGVINYIINWEVTGNEAAETIVITDAIPANTSFESCGACVPHLAEGYVQWTLPGSHDPNDSGSVSLQVRVDTPLADETNIHNWTRISDSNGGTPQAAISDTEVDSDHTLDVEKSGPGGAAAGDQIEYTISYQVYGDEPAPNVVITDAVPTHTTFVSADGGGTFDGATVTWDLYDLAPGDSGEVHMTVKIDDPLADGTEIHNIARMSDDDAGTAADESTVDTTVTSGHAFSIEKSDDPDPVDAGSELVYTIDWSISGSEIAQGVTVVDALPDHVTFVDGTPGYGYDAGAGTVTWDLGTQLPNASGVLTIAMDVEEPLPDDTLLTNQVDIYDGNDGIPANATEQTTVNASHTLDVEKRATPDPVEAGVQLTYVITYAVTGNETAQDVIIQDGTPPNTTFADASGGAWRETPTPGSTGLVRWHLEDLAPGATGSVTIVVNVISPLNDGTIIENTASIADGNGGATDSDTIQTEVQSEHALHVTKTGPTDTSPNAIINYNLHWSVSGNEAAQNVVITDAIPAHTAYVGGGTFMGDHVRWSLGNQEPGDSGDVSFQVRVVTPLTDGTVIDNVAHIYDNNGGTPDDDDALATVHADHTLDVEKSAPDEVVAGGQIQYAIDYTVYGDEAAPNVVINDILPENTTFQSATGSYTGPDANGVITWALGTLNPGQGGVLNLTVQAEDPLANGTEITNTAHVFDADDGEAEDTFVTTISSQHGFTLDKDDSQDPIQAGQQLTYTLSWSVMGSEIAEDVTIVDMLPDQVTYASSAPSGAYDPVEHIITWELGDLDPDAEDAIDVVVNVDPVLSDGTQFTNEAEISDSNGGTPAQADEQTTVNSAHALDVEKSAHAATVQAGEQITYVIAWAASGNEEAQNVVIVDNTPDHTTFASADSSIPATIESPGVGDTGPVRWHLGNQLPGATGVVTLVVDVNSPLDNGMNVDNIASIADDNGGVPDASGVTINVESTHQLDVTKTGEGSVNAGDIIHYTIDWAVSGNESAHSVVITDQVPADTIFNNCGGGDSCSHDPDTEVVTWQLGDRDPGASGNVNLQVQTVSPLPDGTEIENTAYVYDSNAGDTDRDEWTTLVGSGHAFNLSKSSTPDPVEAGGLLNYTIDYEVVGNETAQSVVITDRIPISTTVDWIGDGGTQTGEIISWGLGDLDPGETGDVHFRVQVDEPLLNGVRIYNTAFISDANGGRAEADEDTIVHADHTLQVSKADDPDPVQANSLLTYTLHYRVTGNEPAPNVVIQDDLPVDTSFVGAPDGTFDGTIVQWELGNLVPGDEGDVTMVVRTDELLPDGSYIYNQAHISDDDGAFASSSVQRTMLQSSHELHLEKQDTGYDPVGAGGELVYTIHYTITGQEVAEGVTIQDDVPENTSYVSCEGGAVCSVAGGSVTWIVGDVSPGEDGVVTLTLQVNSPLNDGTVLHNEATIGDDNGGTPVNADEDTTIYSEHSLALTKTDLDDPVRADGSLVYHLNYEVLGNQMAPAVVITDQLPSDVFFQNASGTYSGPDANDVITWTLGDLEPGTYDPIVITVRPDGSLPNGAVLVNMAAIFDGDAYRAEASEDTIVARPVLTASTKLVDKVNAAPSEQLRYTIHLANEGGMGAQAVNVLDELPEEVTYLSGPVVEGYPGGGFWNEGIRTIGWNGDLDAGKVITLTYYVVVNCPLDNGTVITNAATLNYHGAMILGPTTTTVHSAPDLSGSTKDVDRAMALPGELIQYTIKLVNDGDMNASNVLVTDTLPVETTYQDDLKWNQGEATYTDDMVMWEGPVNVGDEVEISYKVRLDDALEDDDVIINVATVDDGSGLEGHAPFETGPAETNIARALSVNIDDSLDTVVPGELLTYTITFQGEDPVDDGELTAQIPKHTQFVAATGNYATNDSSYVNWDLAPLASNFVDTVLLVVQVDPVLPDGTRIENHAIFTGEGESAQNNDETVVTSSPDVSASVKQVSAESAYAGDTLVYTIILNNSGTMNTDAAVMTDTIPQYTNYVAGSVSGGSYDPLEQAITWAGPLSVGDQVTITFSVVITELEFIPTVSEPINNVAQIDDGYSGHEALDLQAETHLINQARPDRYKAYLPLIFKDHTPVIDLPDLVVTDISIIPEEPAAGQAVDIAIMIENQSTRAPESCFWVDLYINPTDLPIQVNQGWFDAGSEAGLVWSLCELDPGESVILTIDDSREEYSQFAGSFSEPGVQTLYGQVDSWNPGVDYGAVYEFNEQNNVYGPYQVTVIGEGGAVGANGVRATLEPPPSRPNIPSH